VVDDEVNARTVLADLLRDEILRATGGSTSCAAEMLGLSARTIQDRFHEYNAAPRSEIAVVRKPERDGTAS
jgi:hypothetical protein